MNASLLTDVHESYNFLYGYCNIGVRGKTDRNKPDRVMTDYVAVFCDFLALHKYITLVSDVYFVDNVASLVTIVRGIKFVTIEFIRTLTAKELSKILKRVMGLYTRGSMKVQTNLRNMEFDKTLNDLMDNVVVNTSHAKEHVAEIER